MTVLRQGALSRQPLFRGGTKPLRQDWAVTGEISLSGEIKPVGGVYEKAFGAHQAGMKGLIIPAENKEDIGETHFGMEVAAVRTIEDVLDKILVK